MVAIVISFGFKETLEFMLSIALILDKQQEFLVYLIFDLK